MYFDPGKSVITNRTIGALVFTILALLLMGIYVWLTLCRPNKKRLTQVETFRKSQLEGFRPSKHLSKLTIPNRVTPAPENTEPETPISAAQSPENIRRDAVVANVTGRR